MQSELLRRHDRKLATAAIHGALELNDLRPLKSP
jgi:hypothetical protein